MSKTWIACLLLVLSAGCALVQSPPDSKGLVFWPSHITYLEGEGDLSFSSQKERFSGSFLLSLTYPSHFFLEVYGPFGQTIVHVERNNDSFLFVAGEEKIYDESAMSRRFGFSSLQLMDDLCVKWPVETNPSGFAIHRPGYDVVFSKSRRGKQSVCWEKHDSRICLVFDKVIFEEP
jgi:hypothetical protein